MKLKLKRRVIFMGDDDFDLEALAVYLHLSPAQVVRLIERGKLAGRRVSGEWRFSRPEINRWLEERIGLSDPVELERMERALDRSTQPGDETRPLASMFPVESIDLALPAKTRNSAIAAMTQLAGRSGLLWDPEKMAEAVLEREEMHPTALENGVALLHPRRPQFQLLAEPFFALGRVDRGIPFGGSRGVLTDIFFLICSQEDHSHLRNLARLSRMIADEEFLPALRATTEARAARDLIGDWEHTLAARGD